MTRRSTILLGILAGLLVLTAWWSYRYMASRRRIAATAQADLADCLRIAGQIERLRRRPTLAAHRERLASETTGLIEEAARSAGIPADSLSRISPGRPRRVDDTAYQEKPTRVLLRKVTRRQLVVLMHRLLSAGAGLHAKSIRLSAPRHDDSGDRWTVELVLTDLIYDPPRLEN